MKNIKFILLIFFISACTSQGLESHHHLAENLFFQGKYKASIKEFDRIILKDPTGEFGIKSLKRKALIEEVYLNDYYMALKSYFLLLERLKDKNHLTEVNKKIANIYFSKMQDYFKAAKHYGALFESNSDHPKADFYGYRLGRSLFMLSQFDDAMKVFNYIEKKYKKSFYYKKARLEIGNILSVRGKCEKALKVYSSIVNEIKEKDILVEAKLGIAHCYEALNKLDEAYKILTEIKENYPSPEVISLKIDEIKKRKISKFQ